MKYLILSKNNTTNFVVILFFRDNPLASEKKVLSKGRPLFPNHFLNLLYSLSFHVFEAFLKIDSAVKLWLSEFDNVNNERIGFEFILLISTAFFI